METTKTRNKIDRDLFVQEAMNAKTKGLTLTQFTQEFASKYNRKAASIAQKYADEKKMLKAQLAVASEAEKGKLTEFLNSITLKDGRVKGVKRTRKPVNKLSVYETLLAKSSVDTNANRPAEETAPQAEMHGPHPITPEQIPEVMKQIEGLLIGATTTHEKVGV